MTSLLQDFRRQLEHENGEPIHELDKVNAAEMLAICAFSLAYPIRIVARCEAHTPQCTSIKHSRRE